MKERRVVELAPQILVEKHGEKAFLSEVAVDMRLARLKVDLAHAKAFEAIVAREMRKAVAVEDGVLSLMAAKDVSDLSTWYFF
ncbi:antibiotic biosynthesis monooxygenase, partial [Streptococcus suis]